VNFISVVAVIVSVYLVASVVGAYALRSMLARYEQAIETGGLRGVPQHLKPSRSLNRESTFMYQHE